MPRTDGSVTDSVPASFIVFGPSGFLVYVGWRDSSRLKEFLAHKNLVFVTKSTPGFGMS